MWRGQHRRKFGCSCRPCAHRSFMEIVGWHAERLLRSTIWSQRKPGITGVNMARFPFPGRRWSLDEKAGRPVHMDRPACFKRKSPPKESVNRNLHNAGGTSGDAVLREDQDGSAGLADIEGRICVYSGKSAFFGCKEEGEALAVGTVCNICLYSRSCRVMFRLSARSKL